jgi:hypothetical protein
MHFGGMAAFIVLYVVDDILTFWTGKDSVVGRNLNWIALQFIFAGFFAKLFV